MSDKTLKEIGAEATGLYAAHYSTKKDPFRLRHAEKYPDFAKTLERQGEVNELASEKFAKHNAEQLHDLAVIEAHLGGAAITVEQPLEIGHKIEVRTPDH